MYWIVAIVCLLLILPARGLIPEPVYRSQSPQGWAMLNPRQLSTLTANTKCFTLMAAIQRFGKSLSLFNQSPKPPGATDNGLLVTQLVVNLNLACDETKTKLHSVMETDESYSIQVTCKKECQIEINSKELWGAIRALTTLEQLVVQDGQNTLYLPIVEIHDKPRFSHRGYLIDSSRHFLSVENILKFVDAMSMVKMNVLHWHIVDANSFPYASYTFPEITETGSFRHFTRVYSQLDVANVLEYARQRGVRIMPEFDTPGHAQSWGKSMPGLLTPCYTGSKPNGHFGPIDPSREENYAFLSSFFEEVVDVFPGSLLHLGGDEVPFGCWASNPAIKEFMASHGIKNYPALESYYIERLSQLVHKIKPSSVKVFWEEVYFNGAMASKNDLVHIWKNGRNLDKNIAQATRDGYKVLVSAPWYLNYIGYGSDWRGYYKYDPQSFNGTEEQKNLVIGGEACVWGEFVDDSNLIARNWPRGAAVAERLWSPANQTNVGYMAQRMAELTCFMRTRGIDAEPANGPGTCEND